MQITTHDDVQRGMMITSAYQDIHRRSPEDSRWITVFGPNADPKVATKLFRENFAEYMRLKNVADFQQVGAGNRGLAVREFHLNQSSP